MSEAHRLAMNLSSVPLEMKKPYIAEGLLEFGSSTWARTRDTRINRMKRNF